MGANASIVESNLSSKELGGFSSSIFYILY